MARCWVSVLVTIFFVKAAALESNANAEAGTFEEIATGAVDSGHPSEQEQREPSLEEGAATNEGEGADEEMHEAEELEEEFTQEDVKTGYMLLGAVGITVGMYQLVNFEDDDIRRYTWTITSTTVSIFSSVLVFQSLNQFIRAWLLSIGNGIFRIVVQHLHCLAYIIAMQICIGIVSGTINREADTEDLDESKWVISDPLLKDYDREIPEERVRNPSGLRSVYIDEFGLEVMVEKKKVNLDRRLRRMKCWATLFAHLAGFSAINAGAVLQIVTIGEEALHPKPGVRPSGFQIMCAYGTVIVSTLFNLGIFRLCKIYRQYELDKALAAHRKGTRAKLCDETVTEAENDVLGLSLSFLCVSAIRFTISGILPDQEGLDGNRASPVWCPLALYGVGLSFAAVVPPLVLKLATMKNTGEESATTRFLDTALNTASMGFAWSVLWATRWAAVRYKALYNIPSMTGLILMAVEMSALVGMIIFILDKIDDAHSGAEDSKAGSQALRTIINALGILVGFSWEHCFEHGVAALSSRTSHPLKVKLLFAVVVLFFIVPAWRRYILFKVMMLQRLKENREELKRRFPDKGEDSEFQFLPCSTGTPHSGSTCYSIRQKDLNWRAPSARGVFSIPTDEE